MNRLLPTLLALSLLAGCAPKSALSPEAAEALRQAREASLRAITEWDLRARAVLRLRGEAYQVGLSWRRAPGNSVLLLEAPFGQGVIRLARGADDVFNLRLPDGRELFGNSAEALLDQLLGWSLPISGLEYWIRGLPHPDGDYARRYGSDGTALQIRQDRWQIDYLDYFEQKPPLPRRIDLDRDGIGLKLVIERWQLTDAGADEGLPGLFPDFD